MDPITTEYLILSKYQLKLTRQLECLVVHMGIEPISPPWKGGVLADRRMDHFVLRTGIEPVSTDWKSVILTA